MKINPMDLPTPDENVIRECYVRMMTAGYAPTTPPERINWDTARYAIAFNRWLTEIKAAAWEEGAQAGWSKSGDGWNGECAYGGLEFTGEALPFRDVNPDTPNPYGPPRVYMNE